jgi:holliday junction DNA helicase RuvB
MPDPALLRQAVQIVTRGMFTMVTEEVAGQWRKRGVPTTTTFETTIPVIPMEDGVEGPPAPDTAGRLALPEYGDLPSLDEARLGQGLTEAPEDAPPELPEDLFGVIVGMEMEKRVLRRVVLSAGQLHALLVGPPGSAKSLFLEELRRLPESRYVVGRNMTSAGLLDIVNGEQGKVHLLLIDEIDKGDQNVLSTLLSVMTGKATRATHGSHLEVDTDIRVVAAANSAEPLHEALRSRFIELHLAPYSLEQRKAVIAGFLANRKDIDPKRAAEIATWVAPLSADVRDAEQIAEVDREDPDLAKQLAERLAHTPAPEPVRSRTKTAP